MLLSNSHQYRVKLSSPYFHRERHANNSLNTIIPASSFFHLPGDEARWNLRGPHTPDERQVRERRDKNEQMYMQKFTAKQSCKAVSINMASTCNNQNDHSRDFKAESLPKDLMDWSYYQAEDSYMRLQRSLIRWKDDRLGRREKTETMGKNWEKQNSRRELEIPGMTRSQTILEAEENKDITTAEKDLPGLFTFGFRFQSSIGWPSPSRK